MRKGKIRKFNRFHYTNEVACVKRNRQRRKTSKLERTRYRNHNKPADFFLGFSHTSGFPLLLCDSFIYITGKVSTLTTMEDVTCERIMKKIEAVLSQDTLLDEFDIVFSLGEVNRSPVVHVEHKLGLESWCVKHVYAYAYAKIMGSKQTKRREDPAQVLRWTQFCLLIAPEVTTFWNLRKVLLGQGDLSANLELHFTRLILSRKPKCMEVFQHRKWMFKNVIAKVIPQQANGPNGIDPEHHNGNGVVFHSEQIERFLFAELDLCTWAANKHQNNYHSWNHRLWVIQQFATYVGLVDVCRAEYEESHKWISVHVSEHSGLHYLQYLLDSIVSLVNESKVENVSEIVPYVNSVTKLYQRELDFNRDLIEEYEDHEALFCHRRFLLTRLRDLLCSSPQRTCSPPPPALKRSPG
ncbi:Protein prenyltransferase alpha subunit repeat-containing protein 1 [Penaeus vannamei]|uniref:Protein prenyltransferase alpha subunit repeat-containing protein 1 n=1 Tax=Penaeus vannamei TaxID=6689 RepID=A0A3R7M684_PENVA|nr:Protein prenyltransferase alpha subunit repeat-containing protein 1 [Penaeus vannamei]